MQKTARNNGSWIPAGIAEAAWDAYDGPELGWALFQLVVQNIDSRVSARAGDVIAALAFLAGRVTQRAFMRADPGDFHLNLSANGVVFLRSDAVSAKLVSLAPGTLASTLTEASVLSGARRFPELAMVMHDAADAMQRRGAADLRGSMLSESPGLLMAQVQEDIDGLLIDPFNRTALVRAAIQACGHAIGYQRTRFCPAEAAELALSVALFGGWLDARETVRG